MILIFGSISIEIILSGEYFSAKTNTVDEHSISVGGKGAAQAIAAARSGADVTLVGRAGNDDFATILINKLRDEEIETASITRSTEQSTGINIQLKDTVADTKSFYAPAANLEVLADHMPPSALNEKAFVLVQTELGSEVNAAALAAAKEAGATTIMNLSPALDLSQQTLDHLDYLIVNQDEAKQLAEKLGLSVEDEAIKIAEGLSKQGKLTCIVTIGDRGCVAYTEDKKGWQVGALDIDQNIIDRSGAQDAYCGVFVACLRTGMTLARSMKRASIAASLACTKMGRIDSLPSLDDIDRHINDLDDPEEISA